MNGLKSLARELPQYGRYNDDMVAHISSDEARLLKSLGGSGTINPTTGLPEFGIGNIFKPVQRAIGQLNPLNPGSAVSKAVDSIPIVGDINRAANNLGTQIFQPLEKAIVQPASAGLASFDKMVGNTIPGGWGTVGMVAGSMIPGMTPLMMGGLGAINGSGVLRPGRGFNLQGAMMGGAMAYGMSSLAQYAQGAATTPDMSGATAPTSGGITPPPVDAIESLNASQGWTGPNATDVGSSIPQNSINAANNAATAAADAASRINPVTGLDYSATGSGLVGNGAQPSIGSQVMSGEFGNAATQLVQNVQQSAYNAYNALGDFANKAVTPSTYTDALSNYGANVAKTGEGAYNLITGAPGAAAAATANATAQGLASPMVATGATIYGGMGLAAVEEQRKYLEEAKKANAISQAEYDKALAEINRSAEDARNAVKEHPFSTNPNRDVSIGDTYYGRTGANENLYARNNSTLYAAGGGVDSLDDQTGMPNRSPVDGLAMGGMGMMGYAAGGKINGYSEGGEPRTRKERDLLDMLDASFKAAPSGQNVEGLGYQNALPSVSGRLGANMDALGGNIRAGISGNAMLTPDKRIMARPEMMDVGYRGQVGSGTLDLNLQRAIQAQAGRGNPYAVAANYTMPFAEGGQARFLSGGGDGMSDSIKATIEGKQEARLADGEFVVPADVVSHLGNGSSKAGAKQLYSMMDKVRKARTGNPKQGKQINPRKFLAA
jgi:hypothetical protein